MKRLMCRTCSGTYEGKQPWAAYERPFLDIVEAVCSQTMGKIESEENPDNLASKQIHEATIAG